jgi:hypothetical protein
MFNPEGKEDERGRGIELSLEDLENYLNSISEKIDLEYLQVLKIFLTKAGIGSKIFLKPNFRKYDPIIDLAKNHFSAYIYPVYDKNTKLLFMIPKGRHQDILEILFGLNKGNHEDGCFIDSAQAFVNSGMGWYVSSQSLNFIKVHCGYKTSDLAERNILEADMNF